MVRKMTLPGRGLSVLSHAARQRMRHYLRAARSLNTRRCYATQWRQFESWCLANRALSLPAEPELVAAYLAERAQGGAALASINVMIAAIAFAQAVRGHRFDRHHPALVLVLQGIRRQHARLQRQAEPLRGSMLVALLGARPRDPGEVRDAALLYTFALRASEAARASGIAPDVGHPQENPRLPSFVPGGHPSLPWALVPSTSVARIIESMGLTHLGRLARTFPEIAFGCSTRT